MKNYYFLPFLVVPFLMLLFVSCGMKKNADSEYDYDKQTLEERWKEFSNPASANCDTLILRQICDYCLGEKSYYHPQAFGSTTTCFCYSSNKYFDDKINDYIAKNKDEIKVIIIENPSDVIDRLKFKGLTQIHTFTMFGNDPGCDAIKTIPQDLLNAPTLRTLNFQGERFPTAEMERIKKEYPNLKFEGYMEEYMEVWDQTVPRE